ncbi:MAG TPA: alpha/beta fold hydrolase [Acidobacteriaceae bacterium]
MAILQLQNIDLRGPSGRLEALLNTGRDNAPFTALVCHPHPPSGGTMHTKAVYHAMKAFNRFGIPVLRFNFRGTGLSEGTFDDARGELDDTRAALDWLAANLHKPILCAGFSFGAYVALRAACSDPRVHALIGLGLPVSAAGRDYSYSFLTGCTQPKLFISGDHDEFSPRAVLEPMVAAAPDPKKIVWIPGSDHFFFGTPDSPASKLDTMRHAMEDWLATTFPELTTA